MSDEEWKLRTAAGAVMPLLLDLAVHMAAGAAAFRWIREKDSAAASVLAASVILIPVMWYMQKTDREKGGWHCSRDIGCGINAKKILTAAAAFLLGAACSMTAGFLMRVSGIQSVFSNKIQESLYTASPWLLVFGPGLLAPVAEELVFRGVLYPRLRGFMTFPAAALVSAGLFAAGHGNMIQALYAFPMGLVLAVLAEKYGFYTAAAFHLGANLLSALIMIRA